MVFTYFKRAAFSIRHFNRMNFFLALYLANDMEEDEEEYKYEIFPWALGRSWKQKYVHFLHRRDQFWARIDHRAVVSSKCCEEIMAIEPDHWAWNRERPDFHGGAVRSNNDNDDVDNDWYPRGPYSSPRTCSHCAPTVQNDSFSPDNTTWYLSSSTDSSPDILPSNSQKRLHLTENDQRFNMKGLKNTLEEDDEGIWACSNEQ